MLISTGNLQKAVSLQSGLKFNGGGHINHSIYWTNLAKDGGEPSKELMEAIKVDTFLFHLSRLLFRKILVLWRICKKPCLLLPPLSKVPVGDGSVTAPRERS